MVLPGRPSLALLIAWCSARDSLATSRPVYDEGFEDGDDMCGGGTHGARGSGSCGVSLLQTHLEKIRRSRSASLDVHDKNSSEVESSTWTSFHLDSSIKSEFPSGSGDAAALIATALTVSNLRFEAVDGGSGRSCRGDSSTDSRPDYYRVEKAETLQACQQVCSEEAECKGVEYNKQHGRCEVWTHGAGIGHSVATTRFFECYRAVRPHFDISRGQEQESASVLKALTHDSRRPNNTEEPSAGDNATEDTPLVVERKQSDLTSFGDNATEHKPILLLSANSTLISEPVDSATSPVELDVGHTSPDQSITDTVTKSNASKAHSLLEDAWDNDLALEWSAQTESTALIQNSDRAKAAAHEPGTDDLKDLYGTVSGTISSPDKNVLAYMKAIADASDGSVPLQKTIEPSSAKLSGEAAASTNSSTNSSSTEGKSLHLLEVQTTSGSWVLVGAGRSCGGGTDLLIAASPASLVECQAIAQASPDCGTQMFGNTDGTQCGCVAASSTCDFASSINGTDVYEHSMPANPPSAPEVAATPSPEEGEANAEQLMFTDAVEALKSADPSILADVVKVLTAANQSAVHAAPMVPDFANATVVSVEAQAAPSSAEIASSNATAEAVAEQKKEVVLDAEKRLAELPETLQGAQRSSSVVAASP